MKRTVRLLRRIILFVLLTIVMLLSIVNIPWFFVSGKVTETDYSNWMNENISFDKKVIDIKMLGAHDALSADIDIFSDVDNKSSDSLMQGFVGKLIKGFSIRQSKTQVVGAKELLESGIRYLDIRISYNESEETYYSVHNYFSSPLIDSLTEISLFLEENPGEFLILDIQHVYGVDYDNSEDFFDIYELFEEASLLDYAYSDDLIELKDITYGIATNNGSEASVMIFSKFTEDNNLFWDYESSIYSPWPNEDEYPKIVDFLEAETLVIDNSTVLQNKFRVMQAVATMEMSLTGIMRSFATWSLLGRAKDFNRYLLDYDNFFQLTEAMPIIMLDFASDKDTVDEFMGLIISYNLE